MAYTRATPPPVEVVAPPYVPYTPPTGGTAPPYVPYTPPPYTPPPMGGTAPDYGFKPPDGPATMALEGWYNPKTGQTFLARSGGYTPPNSDWVRGNFGPDGITPRTPPTEKPVEGSPIAPPYIPPALGVMPPVADPRDSRGGSRQTAPEGSPGEGFNPSPAFARSVLNAGKALSNYPVMAPFGMPAKVLGSLANTYGSYLSSVAERNEAARNVAAGAPSGSLQAQSSRVLSQLRSNEGYGDGPDGPDGPGNDGRGGVRGVSGVTAGVGERGRGEMGADRGSSPADPGRGGGGAHLARGGIATLPLYKPKTGRSPKKPK